MEDVVDAWPFRRFAPPLNMLSSSENAAGCARLSWEAPVCWRGVHFPRRLFCAPMAGLTHSAFRRLVADFGGHGGLFTEMLCGRWLLREDLACSPALKRRSHEGPVVYQLMIAHPADVAAIVERVRRLEPAGIDLNCACPAPHIRATGAGSELYEDRERLAQIVELIRQHHPGLFTVKLRLGKPRPDWREVLRDRLQLLEGLGVDSVTIHPRFSDEKLRRRARQEWYPELASMTRLPVIASGDLTGPAELARHAPALAAVGGVMIGRMAVVQPWLFAHWREEPWQGDVLEVWQRFTRYVQEDFPAQKVFHRVRAFTLYYARNFRFGHTLFAAAQSAQTLEELQSRAEAFLAAHPARDTHPSVQGLA